MDQPTNGINPYLYALSIVSGKWKMSILNHIHYYGFIRFSKTKKTFPISEKVLSKQLKELVADGLVERIQYNEIPLRVKYRLTDAGKKLIPAIDFLYTWSIHRMQELNVPIDPDAFVVHTSSRYDASLKHIIEHYDELCDFFEYADEHQLDIHAALEKLRHS